MKNLLIKSPVSSKRLAPLTGLAIITLAVVGGLILWPSFASMESTLTNFAPNLAPLKSAIPVQNQASTFYLHGTGRKHARYFVERLTENWKNAGAGELVVDVLGYPADHDRIRMLLSAPR